MMVVVKVGCQILLSFPMQPILLSFVNQLAYPCAYNFIAIASVDYCILVFTYKAKVIVCCLSWFVFITIGMP